MHSTRAQQLSHGSRTSPGEWPRSCREADPDDGACRDLPITADEWIVTGHYLRHRLVTHVRDHHECHPDPIARAGWAMCAAGRRNDYGDETDLRALHAVLEHTLRRLDVPPRAALLAVAAELFQHPGRSRAQRLADEWAQWDAVTGGRSPWLRK
jgi:hypothetical protein